MKKLFLTMGLAAISAIGFSQELTKLVDTMGGKTYWSDLGVVQIDGEQGFRVDGSWEYNSSIPIFKGISSKVVGLGSCVENVQVIILFENGKKIEKTSWNKFNCEGNAWYNFTQSEIAQLKTLSISKIRFTNGRNYESMTVDFSEPNYFIDLNKKASSGDYTTIEE
mgnify:FL=1